MATEKSTVVSFLAGAVTVAAVSFAWSTYRKEDRENGRHFQ